MARRLVAALLIVAFGLMVAGPADVGFAQPRPPSGVGQGSPNAAPQRGGFLQFLFGPRQPAVPPKPPSASRNRPTSSAAPPVAVAEVAPKDAGAKRIVVVGDFVAGGLAWGLDQTFANEPRLVVIDRSNGNSGLVRDDYYDWNKELPEILNNDRPDIIVVAVGANDRQQMRDGKNRLQPRSEGWEKAYTQRIEGMVDTLKVFGRPFFWLSAPPMRSTSTSRDMAYLNELYKPRVAAAGGHFIDIWVGFTNEDGRFISSGPDVEGQLRALRNSDGINFTRAGRLKLAFYAEREIRHQTGIGAGSVDLLASASQASEIEIGADGKKRLVGPVISLNDPLPGAASVLAGEAEPAGDRLVGGERVTEPLLATPADTQSPQYLMIIKGSELASVPGRADDFSWPRRAVAAPAGEMAAVSGASPPLAAELIGGAPAAN
jgi:hypothetical protein